MNSSIPSSAALLFLCAVMPVRAAAPVRNCGDLTWAELDEVVPMDRPLTCDGDSGAGSQPDPLARGRALLPCIDDLYQNGAKAKGLPSAFRRRMAKLPQDQQAMRLFAVLQTIAPDRARSIAKQEVASPGLYSGYLISYASVLLPEECDLVLPKLVAAYKAAGANEYLARMIGRAHDPAQLPLLRESLHLYTQPSRRAQVEVAILELEANARGLFQFVMNRKGGSGGAIDALARLKRYDLLSKIASESPDAPLRERARESLAAKVP